MRLSVAVDMSASGKAIQAAAAVAVAAEVDPGDGQGCKEMC
jgi:hypothetical protein